MMYPLQLLEFIRENPDQNFLNVAGSRASKDPEIYNFVKQTFEEAFFSERLSSWIGGPGEKADEILGNYRRPT